MLKGTFPVEKFKQLSTPFYYYDVKLLQDTLDVVKTESGKYGYHVHYAVKANANPRILSIIAANGLGADCVSGGEVQAALDAGFPADKIVFAGVGKADWEINLVLDKLKEMKNVKLIGIHSHIGSQITDMSSFRNLVIRFNEIQEELEAHGVTVENLNFGGGLGIDYYHPNHLSIPAFDNYFAAIHKLLQVRPGQQVHFEPGRSIVAQCGTLISKVLYVKEGETKKFAILDAGFTELIRPAMYDAYHRIENISSDEAVETYDVVGPICESSDVFGKDVELNKAHRGDLIALRSAGAYGEVMASQYNCRHLPKAYYSDTIK